MNKKIKPIIIMILVFIVGISIRVISTNVYFNNKEPKEKNTIDLDKINLLKKTNIQQ